LRKSASTREVTILAGLIPPDYIPRAECRQVSPIPQPEDQRRRVTQFGVEQR
jgi:hypothetical protein